MRRRTSAELALLLTVGIWSLNFSAVKVGVGAISPLAFSVVRFSLGAAVTVAVVAWREGLPRFRRRDLPLLTAAAIFGITINQACFVGALHATSASTTALLVGTVPIWGAVLTAALGQERVGAGHWAAVAVGMAGVVLIVLGSSGGGGFDGVSTGELLALGTAISWAVYSVLIRPLMRRYSALQLSSYMMVVGTALLAPFALPGILGQAWTSVPTDAWLGLLYASLFSVTLTNILYFTAIHEVGPARATLFQYLEPFGGVLFAVLLLRETVMPLQLLGGAVVVGSLFLSRPRPAEIAEPGI
jgi:drug/metabolite transporter (DMT)-like permease